MVAKAVVERDPAKVPEWKRREVLALVGQVEGWARRGEHAVLYRMVGCCDSPELGVCFAVGYPQAVEGTRLERRLLENGAAVGAELVARGFPISGVYDAVLDEVLGDDDDDDDDDGVCACPAGDEGATGDGGGSGGFASF